MRSGSWIVQSADQSKSCRRPRTQGSFARRRAERVLQNLLRERVSVRDAVTILEAMGRSCRDHSEPHADFRSLCIAPVAAADRGQALSQCAGRLASLYAGSRGSNKWLSPRPNMANRTVISTLKPAAIRDILERISKKVGDPGAPVVAVTGSGSRHFFRQIVEPALRNLFFVSHNEVPSEIKVVSLGVIQLVMSCLTRESTASDKVIFRRIRSGRYRIRKERDGSGRATAELRGRRRQRRATSANMGCQCLWPLPRTRAATPAAPPAPRLRSQAS